MDLKPSMQPLGGETPSLAETTARFGLPGSQEYEAVQALEALKSSHNSPRGYEGPPASWQGPTELGGSPPLQSPKLVQPLAPDDSGSLLLTKMATNPLISHAVRAYESSKSYSPSFKYGAEMVERNAILPVVRRLDTAKAFKRQKQARGAAETGPSPGPDDHDTRHKLMPALSDSLRLPPSIAVAGLNMSIESRRKIRFVLHVLKLANQQISNRVNALQESFGEETAALAAAAKAAESDKGSSASTLNAVDVSDEEEEEADEDTLRHRVRAPLFDDDGSLTPFASAPHTDHIRTPAANLRMGALSPSVSHASFALAVESSTPLQQYTQQSQREIVNTVKKIINVVSSFTSNGAGAALPGPERDQIRESIIGLPRRWSSSLSRGHGAVLGAGFVLTSFDHIPAEGAIDKRDKVIVLAQESLEMIHNITKVFDETLSRAETYVREKQYDMVYKKRALIHENERAKENAEDDANDSESSLELVRAC